MATCYLDANVLIGYVSSQHIFHLSAVKIMEKIIRDDFLSIISPLVLDEFLWAMSHQLKNDLQEKDQAYERFDEFLQRILSHPNLKVLSTSGEVKDQFQVLELMKTYQLAPRDAYHLLTAQTHGAEYIATFDSDFDQVFQSGEIKKFIGE